MKIIFSALPKILSLAAILLAISLFSGLQSSNSACACFDCGSTPSDCSPCEAFVANDGTNCNCCVPFADNAVCTTYTGPCGNGAYCNTCSGNNITCMNSCPPGYNATSQLCNCNWAGCGNPVFSCQFAGCTPTCGAWSGGCGNVTRSCTRADCSTYSESACLGSCGCGAWSTGCGNATRTCMDNSCNNYSQSQCFDGNCGAHCQTGNSNGPSCNTGTVLDSCNNSGYASGVSCPVCTPGSVCNGSACSNLCGPVTQVDTNCNCGTTTTNYCVGGCGWTCDAPYDGWEHDRCTPGGFDPATYCTTHQSDAAHCGRNTRCNPAWVQASGSDVHSNGPISGLVIPGASANLSGPSFNYFGSTSPLPIPSQYGIVTSASSIVFMSPVIPGPSSDVTARQTNPGDQANPNHSYVILNYNSGNPILLNPRYDFTYFWNRSKGDLDSDGSPNSNTISSNDVNPPGGGVGQLGLYPSSGCTLNVSGGFPLNGANKSAVVYIHENPSNPGSCPNGVDLNFTSTANIDSTPGTPGNKGNVLVWVVSGNVNINSAVTKADGAYIVEGKFTTQSACPGRVCSGFTGDSQLVINGSVAAYGCTPGSAQGTCSSQAIDFQRINTDPNQPSEKIIYNADVTNVLSLVGESSFTWTEVSP